MSRQTVNELLRERRSVSPEMALRFSRLFGNSPRILVKRSARRGSLGSRTHDWKEDRKDFPVERGLTTRMVPWGQQLSLNDLNGA